jgi:hypothetical protein
MKKKKNHEVVKLCFTICYPVRTVGTSKKKKKKNRI